MNTHQIATHIVEGIYGRRAMRRGQRDAAERKRQADFTAPRMWVHAHINTRSDYKSGYLAELVASNSENPAQARDWQEYLAESRAAFRAGQKR